MSSPSNIDAIAKVSRGLGDELEHVAFVGGAITELYALQDVGEIRATKDVDCIVRVADVHEYYAFVAKLQSRGFEPCNDPGAPVCRLVFEDVRVDIMPTTPTPIGPTNVWYEPALTHAGIVDVGGHAARVIRPIYFVATKIEAFQNRGRDDYMASHDMEDLLTVLAGLPSLRAEIEDATTDPGRAIRSALMVWRSRDAFMDALQGHFTGDAMGSRVAAKLRSWITALR